MASLQSLISDMQTREQEALDKNKAREVEIRGIYDSLITKSRTGGAAKVAGLADIEQSKKKAIGGGLQQMVSSGLYGTTVASSIPVQAENQASLSRLKLEDLLEQRTQNLELNKSSFVERIENPYPDYNLLTQAVIAQASQPKLVPAMQGGRYKFSRATNRFNN